MKPQIILILITALVGTAGAETITIETEPAGADVYVEDRMVGQAPVEIEWSGEAFDVLVDFEGSLPVVYRVSEEVIDANKTVNIVDPDYVAEVAITFMETTLGIVAAVGLGLVIAALIAVAILSNTGGFG